ncbi:hypothetical protein [Mesoflavibacter sp. CH_XMU1404-2]|uniref:hypothetical protein n=1 Tax=Mesoflavibacter sp. CH_XMU1404-2 TaxID=3107766 RepID=UPI0030095D06
MKFSILTLFIISTISVLSQSKAKQFTLENFNQEMLVYTPMKNVHSNNNFKNGEKFLEETKTRVKKNGNFDVADYWNILTALDCFNESQENLAVAFAKFVLDERSCEYVVSFEKYFKNYSAFVKSKLEEQLKLCQVEQPKKKNKSFNIKDYAIKNKLDESLVKIINEIDQDDQYDRYNPKIQDKLDLINQQKIDSLFNKYNTYIGKSLVGEKFEHVMWEVIQHSNLFMMEKYLPIVHAAVKQKELAEAPLKMLIDRIYTAKYGYQIFGSQGGVKIAKQEIQNEVKAQYKLN